MTDTVTNIDNVPTGDSAAAMVLLEAAGDLLHAGLNAAMRAGTISELDFQRLWRAQEILSDSAGLQKQYPLYAIRARGVAFHIRSQTQEIATEHGLKVDHLWPWTPRPSTDHSASETP